ncbi:MAG: hypothetical protein U0521_00665 [Anaerolineae bacterium]
MADQHAALGDVEMVDMPGRVDQHPEAILAFQVVEPDQTDEAAHLLVDGVRQMVRSTVLDFVAFNSVDRGMSCAAPLASARALSSA